MSIQVKIFLVSLILVFFANTCQSKLSHEVKPTQCKPSIFNPRVNFTEIGTYKDSTGKLWNAYTLALSHTGQCVDNSSVFQYKGEFFDAEGKPTGKIEFPVNNFRIVGKDVFMYLLVIFSNSQYVEATVTLTTDSITSQPVIFTFKKLPGAI